MCIGVQILGGGSDEAGERFCSVTIDGSVRVFSISWYSPLVEAFDANKSSHRATRDDLSVYPFSPWWQRPSFSCEAFACRHQLGQHAPVRLLYSALEIQLTYLQMVRREGQSNDMRHQVAHPSP